MLCNPSRDYRNWNWFASPPRFFPLFRKLWYFPSFCYYSSWAWEESGEPNIGAVPVPAVAYTFNPPEDKFFCDPLRSNVYDSARRPRRFRYPGESGLDGEWIEPVWEAVIDAPFDGIDLRVVPVALDELHPDLARTDLTFFTLVWSSNYLENEKFVF